MSGTRHPRTRMHATLLAAGSLVLSSLLGACVEAHASSGPPPGVTPDAEAAAALRNAGRDASLAVLPTIVAGRPMAPVGEVVALMLERGGMTKLDLPKDAFSPAADADPAAVAESFGAFVRDHPGESDFTLLADFAGSPQKGFESVTGWIVDRQGRLAWCERSAKGDRAFDRAKVRDPMGGCVLMAAMLRPALSLGDPTSSTAPTGPIAERLRRESRVPDRAELDAIDARTKQFAARCGSSTMLVVPTRVNGQFSAESAARIAEQLTAARCGTVRTSPQGPTAARPSTMNQQQVLWSLARELSAWAKSASPDADFVLMADELVGERGVLGVQIAICDRAGEIVFVDLQNDHQKAFAALKPSTAADCDRLVVEVLKEHCGT